MISLKEQLRTEILPKLKADLGLKNSMAVPRLVKVTVASSFGSKRSQGDAGIDKVVQTLAKITGQRPVVTLAKKSIAGFKLREGEKIGAMVTLRGQRMYDFLTGLIHIAIPRMRDFRGLSHKAFDASGNYTLGIKEAAIFPELSADDNARGITLQVVISTTARNKQEGYKLLKGMMFPVENLEQDRKIEEMEVKNG